MTREARDAHQIEHLVKEATGRQDFSLGQPLTQGDFILNTARRFIDIITSRKQ